MQKRLVFGFLMVFSNAFSQSDADWQALDRRLDAAAKAENWPLAEALADSLLRFLPKNEKPLRANAFSRKGSALRQRGQTEKALAAHQKALALREPFFGKNSPEVGRSLQNIGNCWQSLGQAERAVVCWRKNLAIQTEKGPPADRAAPLRSLGRWHLEAGRADSAAHFFERLWRLLQAADPPDARDLGQAADRLAQAFALGGELRRAVEQFDEALSSFEKQPAATTRDRGRTLFRQGNALVELGDFEAARWRFEAALALFAGDDAEQADLLNSLGLIEKAKGRFDEAEAYFLRAVDGFGEKSPVERAGGLRNLGSVCLEKGEPQAALEYFETAKAAFDRAGEGLESGRSSLGAARALRGSGRLAEAEKCLFEAAKKLPHEAEEILFERGELALARADFAAAIAFFEKGRQALERKTPLPTVEKMAAEASFCRALTARARTTGRAGDWQRAAAAPAAALDRFDALRTALLDESSERDVQNLFIGLCGHAVESGLALGDTAAAFAASERSKRLFFEQLARRTSRRGAAENDPAAAALQAVDDSLAMLKRQKRAARTGPLREADADLWGIGQNAELARLAARRERLAAARERLLGASNGLFPSKTWAEMPKWLAAGETSISFFWGDERVFAFAVGPKGATARAIEGVSAASLGDSVRMFFVACAVDPSRLEGRARAAALETTDRLGQWLFERLLGPFSGFLSEKIAIAADGPLCFLPFDALLKSSARRGAGHFRSHDFFGKSHVVRHVFSAAEAADGGAFLAEKREKGAGFLAMSPRFDGSWRRLAPLVSARREAAAAAQFFGGELLADGDATEATFVEKAPTQAILHLATHGVFDDRSPEDSFLAFQNTDDGVENEQLFAAEIERLRLRAELVSLGACQTAMGQMQRGEGLLSIAQAFRKAGAEAVVAARWNLEDGASEAIFRAFYAHLQAKKPKSVALAEAKRAYLAGAEGLRGHPFFWATTAMTGNDAPLEFAPKGWKTKLFFGLLIAGAAAGLFRFWRRRKPFFQ